MQDNWDFRAAPNERRLLCTAGRPRRCRTWGRRSRGGRRGGDGRRATSRARWRAGWSARSGAGLALELGHPRLDRRLIAIEPTHQPDEVLDGVRWQVTERRHGVFAANDGRADLFVGDLRLPRGVREIGGFQHTPAGPVAFADSSVTGRALTAPGSQRDGVQATRRRFRSGRGGVHLSRGTRRLVTGVGVIFWRPLAQVFGGLATPQCQDDTCAAQPDRRKPPRSDRSPHLNSVPPPLMGTPRYGRPLTAAILNSVRRFWARASGVALSAMGFS